MSVAAKLIIVLILVIAYAGVVLWYLHVRRRGDAIRETMALALAETADVRTMSPRAEALMRKAEDRKSRYLQVRDMIGVDDYEAQYYPISQWATMVLAILIAIGVLAFCHMVFGYPVVAYEIALPAVSVYFMRKLFEYYHSKRRGGLFSQLPDTLDSITRALRIGVSMNNALTRTSVEAPEPTATEFRKLASNISVGMSLHDAVRVMARDNKLPEYRFMAIAIGLQSTTGGNIGATLENVARVVRSRVAIKQRGRALTGEARASALILTVLPVLVVIALAFIEPKYAMKMFTTQSGRHYFGVSTFMLVFGQGIMRNMLRKTLEGAR